MVLHIDYTGHNGIRLIPMASKLLSSVIIPEFYKQRKEQTLGEQNKCFTSSGFADQAPNLWNILGHRLVFLEPKVTELSVICLASDPLHRFTLCVCLSRAEVLKISVGPQACAVISRVKLDLMAAFQHCSSSPWECAKPVCIPTPFLLCHEKRSIGLLYNFIQLLLLLLSRLYLFWARSAWFPLKEKHSLKP